MGQKAITIYTPPTSDAHIYAEDEAQLNRARFGGSGITQADNLLACVIVNNNTVRLSSGQYSMQGYMIAVTGGTTEDLTVESGVAGAYRHDLVIAEFVRGGGDVADQFMFKVIKGTEAATESEAQDPALTQEDLTTGGSRRQEALYRLTINGESLTGVARVANYVGNVYQ